MGLARFLRFFPWVAPGELSSKPVPISLFLLRLDFRDSKVERLLRETNLNCIQQDLIPFADCCGRTDRQIDVSAVSLASRAFVARACQTRVGAASAAHLLFPLSLYGSQISLHLFARDIGDFRQELLIALAIAFGCAPRHVPVLAAALDPRWSEGGGHGYHVNTER